MQFSKAHYDSYSSSPIVRIITKMSKCSTYLLSATSEIDIVYCAEAQIQVRVAFKNIISGAGDSSVSSDVRNSVPGNSDIATSRVAERTAGRGSA